MNKNHEINLSKTIYNRQLNFQITDTSAEELPEVYCRNTMIFRGHKINEYLLKTVNLKWIKNKNHEINLSKTI